MTEFAWVIEIGDTSAPDYYAPLAKSGWSKDHLEACRFARKQDAEAIAHAYAVECIGPDEEIELRFVEHGWG